jgi:hypothetical protein
LAKNRLAREGTLSQTGVEPRTPLALHPAEGIAYGGLPLVSPYEHDCIANLLLAVQV